MIAFEKSRYVQTGIKYDVKINFGMTVLDIYLSMQKLNAC